MALNQLQQIIDKRLGDMSKNIPKRANPWPLILV